MLAGILGPVQGSILFGVCICLLAQASGLLLLYLLGNLQKPERMEVVCGEVSLPEGSVQNAPKGAEAANGRILPIPKER